MLGCVRTWKEGKTVRGTHFLEMVGVGTSQDMEKKEASKGHTLPEEGRHQDCSGHQKKASEQGGTHLLERQTLRLVRTWK